MTKDGTCASCGSDDTQYIAHMSSFSIWACKNCGTVSADKDNNFNYNSWDVDQ